MAKYNEVRDIQSQITELQRRMLEMETATRFTSVNLADGTSIRVGAGGSINVADGGVIQVIDESQIFIDNAGSIEVADGGDINVRAGGQIRMDAGSELSTTGALQVLGSLSLPSGIIDNEALASPITVAMSPTVTRSAWAVEVGILNIATARIPVPSGFTRALVFAVGSVQFQDTTPNWVQSRLVIDDLLTEPLVKSPTQLQSSQSFMTSKLLTTLDAEIMIDIELRAEHSSTDTDGRIAQVAGLAVFFR